MRGATAPVAHAVSSPARPGARGGARRTTPPRPRVATQAAADPSTSTSTPTLADTIRPAFPCLAQTIHGKPLIYLDSGATSQKPDCVLQAMDHYYTHDNANVHRGVHVLAARATASYEGGRAKVAGFIGAGSPSEIVLTRGATEAINLVAASWGGANLKAGDIILVSVAEHHANLVPWQLIAEKTGARVVGVPLTADKTQIDLAALRALLAEHAGRVKVVALVHMSNVLGCVLPDTAQLGEEVRKAGAILLLDACQSVPTAPVNVSTLGADFLVASSHKMAGPTGIGFLWGKPDLLASMPPFMGGGEMIERVEVERSTFAPPPARFEPGTPPIAEAVGLGAAVDFLTGLGMDRVAAWEAELGGVLWDELRSIDGVTVYGPNPHTTPHRAALAAFNVDGLHASDVSALLDSAGVAVRAGHHCCQPLHTALGVSASARASPYIYNTTREIVDFGKELREAIKFFRDAGIMLNVVARLRETFQRSSVQSPRRSEGDEAAEHGARVATARRALADKWAAASPPPPTLLLTAARVAAAHFDGALTAGGLAALPPDLAEVLLDALAGAGALTTPRLARLCGVAWQGDGGEDGEEALPPPPPPGAEQAVACLRLASLPGVCDAWLSLIPPGRLAAVDVSGCGVRGVTDEGLSALAWAHAETLTSLVAAGARAVGDDGVVAVAAAARHLRRLDLSGCDAVGRRSVRAIGGLTDLTALSLCACPAAAGEGPGGAGAGGFFGRALATLPALASLDAGWCRALGDADAIALARAPRPNSLAGLTFLSLAHTAVGDVGVAAVAAQCGGLKHLDLEGLCPRLGARGVSALAAAGAGALSALTSLDLSHSGGPSEGGPSDAVFSVLGALPSLARLRLAHTAAGDSTAAALAGGRARGSLTCLDLEACGLTDGGLTAAVLGLPYLAALSVADCTRVGDAGAAALAGAAGSPAAGVGGARCLETLRADFSNVSDAGLAALGRGPGCRRLTSVSFEGPGISDAGIVAFLAPRAEAAVWEWEEEWVEAEEEGGVEGVGLGALDVPGRKRERDGAGGRPSQTAPVAVAGKAAAPGTGAVAPPPPPSPSFATSPTSVLPGPREVAALLGRRGRALPTPSPPPPPSVFPFGLSRTPSSSEEPASAASTPPSTPFSPLPGRPLVRRLRRVRVRGAPADLRSLSLGGCCRLGEASAAAIGALGGGLVELEAHGLPDAGAVFCGRLTSLTRLSIPRTQNHPALTDAGLAALAAGIGGPACALASLNLVGSSVTRAGLASLLPAFGASLEHAVLPAASVPAGERASIVERLRVGHAPRLRWVKWH